MSSEETDRAAFVFRIDPDKVEGYRELHEDVPEYVTDAMRRAGVSDFRLFLRGEIAVCVLDVEDTEQYEDVMAADERIEEWERKANTYKLEGMNVDDDAEEMIPWMEEIWRFTPGNE